MCAGAPRAGGPAPKLHRLRALGTRSLPGLAKRPALRGLEIAMSIGIWVVVGVIAGVLASKLIIRSGEGLARDIGLGIGGAIVGGWIFAALSSAEATGLDVFGLVVTIASAGAALVVYHTLFPHVRQG